mgnify:CR=1 FL=1
MLDNLAVAKILSEIGEYLAMSNEFFKARAYRHAAATIAELPEALSLVYARGGVSAIEAIPGVGVSIAEKIIELLMTGRCVYYDELRHKTPVDLSELSGVEGLGPKKIKLLYEKLRVRTLADLERVARAQKIRMLEGFGEKTEVNILRSIAFLKTGQGRFLLGDALPQVRVMLDTLRAQPFVSRAEVAGSIRRRKETVGDADIVVIAKRPKEAMDFFVAMPNVAHVLAHGDTKSAVKLANGLQVDLRVVPEESYGAALNYFTGSKEHNIALRQRAIERGLKLNEYGVFKLKNKNEEIRIGGASEEEIYDALGLDYIPPELREMTGEIAASESHALPTLIDYDDLQGDLQVQTNWTDGSHSIEEMARSAMKAGLRYIAITDHTKRLAMTHGLDASRVALQIKEIQSLNQKIKKTENKEFRILSGSECDILKDGSLDLPDEILKQLDVVGVSVHSFFALSSSEQTARVCRAMENPHADILFHPTGRRIGRRPPYIIDIDAVIAYAKQTKTVLEIDAFPDRLDLRDEYIRKCIDAGVSLSIDSDAHAAEHFSVLEFGIAQARRGWATKHAIINTLPCDLMLDRLKK